MSKSLYETLKRNATSHVRAYESPEPFDNATIQQYRDPGCVHFLHPVDSIPSPFNGPIEPSQFAQFMTFFGSAIERLSFDIQDAVIDTEKRTVVMRLRATFDFKAFGDKAKEEGYTADYMWLMEMNEDNKIIRVEEYLDPQRLMGHVKPRAEQYTAQEH